MKKIMAWIMRVKLKYLILMIITLFISGLLVLHIANDFGRDDVIVDSQEKKPYASSSDHVPDYILEEQALPMSDTMEELDDGNWHDFVVDRVTRPILNAQQYAEKEDLPFIMWWTPFTGETGRIKKCFVGNCFFTQNRSLASHPQLNGILFYGTDFKVDDIPLPRKSTHEWGLLHEESPKNNALFFFEDTMEAFNHTSTFKQQSSYPLSTQYINNMEYLLRPLTYTTAQRDEFKQTEGLAAVAYVQSGCNPPSDRDVYIQELMRYIKVDSYGRCLHNKDLPQMLLDPLTMFDKAYLAFFEKYKFILSFENARCDDYMTEKIFRTLHMGSVPIYLGAPNLREWLPDKKSVIMVDDFESPEALAKHIKHLDANPAEYDKLLQFKTTNFTTSNKKLKETLENRQWGINTIRKMNFVTGFECHVCDQIHRNRIRVSEEGKPPLQHRATLEHYGCPKPTRFPFPDLKGAESWERSNWKWDYENGRKQAAKLKSKLSS